MRFVEYDKATGKIMSVLNAPSVFEDNLVGFVEVPEHFQCDPSSYVVKNGQVVRAWETGDERREREHAEQERKQEGLIAVGALAKEFLLAMLFGDEKEMARLKKEAEPYKVYLGR